MANFDINSSEGKLVNSSKGGSPMNAYVRAHYDESISWADLRWLIR